MTPINVNVNPLDPPLVSPETSDPINLLQGGSLSKLRKEGDVMRIKHPGGHKPKPKRKKKKK